MAFPPTEPESGTSPRTVLLSFLAVLLVGGAAALFMLRRAPARSGAVDGNAAYAEHLQIGGIQLSEATSGTGSRATYVDGIVRNTGTETVTSVAVQVSFHLSDSTNPYRETLPLAVVRTREPYVDLQSLSSAPLRPGEQREFRLILESVPATWDVKPPDIRVVHAGLK